MIAEQQYRFMKKDYTYRSAHMVVAFLDLTNALDTVEHDILLDKLNNYGIRGEVLQLPTSYLEKTFQTVKINVIIVT